MHPQPESYFGNVNSVGPRSVYDESKRFGETLGDDPIMRAYGMPTRIVRIFNTYGPRLRPADGRARLELFSCRPSPAIRLARSTAGALQTRSFCFVDDQAASIALAFDSDVSDPVNIGNPTEYTMFELRSSVHEVAGARPDFPHLPGPADQVIRSIGAGLDTCGGVLLGWSPTIEIAREGLERYATPRVPGGTSPGPRLTERHRRSASSR